jgi:hypothetical protein
MDSLVEGPVESDGIEEHRGRTMDRRQLLKTLIAAGGAGAILTLLPDVWIRPVVEIGVLPSHAQVSYTPTPSSMSPLCYTPTPSPTTLCYTPTPSPFAVCYTPTPSPLPPSPFTSSKEARRLLLEQLLAEERFPQDIARELG